MVKPGLLLPLLAVPWISACGAGVVGFEELDSGGAGLPLVKVHSGTYSSPNEAFNWSGDLLDGDGLASGLTENAAAVSGVAGSGTSVTTSTQGLRARMDLVFDASNPSADTGDSHTLLFTAVINAGSRVAPCTGGAVDPDADGFEIRFWWPGKTPQGWSNSFAEGLFSSGSGIPVVYENIPGSDVEPNQAFYSVGDYPSAIIVSIRSTGDAPSGGCSVVSVSSAELAIR